MNLHQQLWHDMQQMVIKLSDHQYTFKANLLHNASIGEHLRHTYEFYECLVQAHLSGFVNYETRKRDQKLQTHRTYALEQIEKLQEGLKHLYKNQEALILHSKESELHQVSTTIARELVYCLDHAVHHQALIKIGLRELDLDHLVPDYFGVAFSTLRYRSSLAKSSDK